MVLIFAKAHICRGNMQVHLQFFWKSKLSRHRKAKLLRKWIALVLQVKLRCLVKANALVLGNIALLLSLQIIVLVFTKEPSAERYLANIFLPVFL